MPRILHLRSTGALLGAESVILELCQQLPDWGFETVIGIIHDTGSPHPELAKRAEEQGLKVHIFEAKKRLDFSCIHNIQNYIAKFQPDIIHCHGYREDLYTLATSTFAPRTNSRLIATNHLWKKGNLRLKLYALLDSLALTQFSHIVAVSAPILKEMKQLPYLANNKMSVVTNGIDVTQFGAVSKNEARAQLGLSPTTTLISTVSSLTLEKGHRFLLKALSDNALKDRDWKLLIVGDGPLRNELCALTNQIGLQQKVSFLGARSDIPLILAAIDIFALPSLREGLPMALLEAMASGAACVASAVGEIPTVLQKSDSGLLVSPEDAPSITTALTDLVGNTHRIAELGKNAKKRVSQHYSARAMAEQYVSLYNKILST